MKQPSKRASELLGDRNSVFLIAPDATVLSALEVLAEKDVGALIVCDQGKLVGIVSERDYARKVERLGRTARDTRVREIMTADVLHVSPDDTVDQCRLVMKRNRIRHLPVIDKGRVVGVLSNRDVVEEVLIEEERLIRDLETERLMATNTGVY
jgi:CBS domain-containing protein